MFNELRKKAGAQEPQAPAKGQDDIPPAAPEAPAEKPAEPAAPAAPPEKGKVNPWKLVDEHKAARAKAEQEVAELRKGMVDPKKVESLTKEIEETRKRNEELEEHMRFIDFSKSKEFEDKYRKPYTDAWTRWMNELSELTVQDAATGNDRPLEAKDLLRLVTLPLREAREEAEQAFGNSADDIMQARKEIKSLWEAQNRALEEARTGGKERLEKQQREAQERAESLRKEITGVWESANQSAQTDERFAKFFKPVEGDEEGNQRLAKGYELADRAFRVSPLDPSLTTEQRAEIVRLHAAVRNRAAAFGRLSYQNQQLQQQIEALTKELNSYKESTPGASPEPGSPDERPATGSAKDQVMGALRKLAH